MEEHFDIRNGCLCVAGDGRRLRIRGLTVRNKLGAGANGSVFEARDNLGRNLALKIWFRRRQQNTTRRAFFETRKLASFGHPLVVTVHRFGNVAGYAYAVMELVNGNNAAEWLRKANPNAEQRLAVWQMYSRALHDSYDAGVLHGDPHTGNILVFEDKQGVFSRFHKAPKCELGLKITDFGTSYIWSSKERLRSRECRVLVETAERLFGSEIVRLLYVQAVDDPSIVLSALDRIASHWYNISKYKIEYFEYPEACHAYGYGLAESMAEVPLLDFEGVFESFRLYMPMAKPDFCRTLAYRLYERGFQKHIGTGPIKSLDENSLRVDYRKYQELFIASKPHIVRTAGS